MSAAPALARKSPEAFRTISEAAAELDVQQHVLRFWETRFAQIRPVKRGGGRRYYRPEDIDLLRGIRALLYSDGYTIKGVQKILREQGVRHVAEVGRQPPQPKRRRTRDAENGVPLTPKNGHERAADMQPDLLPVMGNAHPLEDAAHAKLKNLLQELHRLKKQLRAARERISA